MQFNLKEFIQFVGISFYKSFFFYKISFKRITLLLYFYLLLPIWQIPVWLGLFFDRIIYPNFSKVEVKEPIFIIGNPRSGTTFLHRLLAKDKSSFTIMKAWEIFMAPSILGRKFLKLVAYFDKKIGSPFINIVKRADSYIQNNKYSKLHKTPLWEAEEDDNLLLHIWSNMKFWLATGIFSKIKQYIYFDQQMPLSERKRIINFYKGCLQRHVFFHKAQNKHYLSKSPYFTPKIHSLLKCFPDAKIIYLVRNPMDMIPSYVNLLDTAWEETGGCAKDFESQEHVINLAKHFYKYPIEQFKLMDKKSFIVLKTEDLAKTPKKVIKSIYKRFDIDLNPEYEKELDIICGKSREYKSKQIYSYKELGLNKSNLKRVFKGVFKRFGYST